MSDILLVEDETDLLDLLCYNLKKEGHTCRCASNGVSALAEVDRRKPDIIILDRMLPKMSGDEVLAELKRDSDSAKIPIIMLTAKADESDELVGFALGADDYVTKPFSMKSLVARVGAVTRRARSSLTPADVLSIGPYSLDRSRHELSVASINVSLTATEFRVLSSLMAANGRVLTREQLINAALGTDVAVTDRTIDVHVSGLRKKILSTGGENSAVEWIQTIRGVGYTFRQPD